MGDLEHIDFLKKMMKNFEERIRLSEENHPKNGGPSKSDIIAAQYIREHGGCFPVVSPDGRRQLVYVPPCYLNDSSF